MENNTEALSEYVGRTMRRASGAAAIFSQFDQAQTDKIVKAVHEVAFNNRVRLAKDAVEETGIGNWKDKVIKNVVASKLVYEDIKGEKTAGIIHTDRMRGIIEIAQPMGPILAIIPVTNPTSTTIFKILIALKSRNPIIISPSRRAVNCCVETARICYDAAIKAGAPEFCIQWPDTISREQTQMFMHHEGLSLILATGGKGLVQSAYSSGTPTIGVGAGNVPVLIEESADVEFAAEQICISKLFDNGTICASEQAIIVEKCQKEEFIKALEKQNAYFLSPEETDKLRNIAYDSKKKLMSSAIVGLSAKKIAEMAGIDAPKDVRLLVVPMEGVGPEYPLSSEILAPIIAFYVKDNFNDAANLCIDLNYFGGIGHTACIYSNDLDKVKEFTMIMNAGRILVNTPSSHGAVGGLLNMLRPSFTLGCGTGGKNITSDNVTAKHLLNIQRVAFRRENQRLMQFDMELFYDESLDTKAIEKIYNWNR